MGMIKFWDCPGCNPLNVLWVYANSTSWKYCRKWMIGSSTCWWSFDLLLAVIRVRVRLRLSFYFPQVQVVSKPCSSSKSVESAVWKSWKLWNLTKSLSLSILYMLLPDNNFSLLQHNPPHPTTAVASVVRTALNTRTGMHFLHAHPTSQSHNNITL